MQEKTKTSWRKRMPDLSLPVAIILYSLLFGFVVTSNGMTNTDDMVRMRHSNWLLGEFGLIEKSAVPNNYYYPPLWETAMGISSKFLFSWMHDEIWVRHAVTFALVLTGLSMLFFMLRKIGISFWGTLLIISGIFGYTRFFGNAMFNVKDPPGAIVFLICTVGMWQLLTAFERKGFSVRLLSAIGIVSALPYLVRSPLITLLPLAMIFLFFFIVRNYKTLTMLQALTIMLLPVFVAGLFIIVVSPALWTFGPREIHDTSVLFNDFPLRINVRLFGLQYRADQLPFWYALAWIPVGIQPGAFIAFLTGIFLVLWKRRSPHWKRVRWGVGKVGIDVGFPDWIALVTFVSFAGIIVLRPTLYDEDRHLLFLMLSLYVLGFLGLEHLHDNIKKILTILLLIWSLLSLHRWGIYAYIYRSPLIASSFRSYDFMNDYYGACGVSAATYLANLQQKVVSVQSSRYVGNVAINNIFKKRSSGFFTQSTNSFMPKNEAAKPREPYWYLLIDTRATAPMNNPNNLKAKSIVPKWQETLPTGEVACALYYITPF